MDHGQLKYESLHSDERDAGRPRPHLAAFSASVIVHAALLAAIVFVARPIAKPNGDLVLAYLVEVGDSSAGGGARSAKRGVNAAAAAPIRAAASLLNAPARVSGKSPAIARATPRAEIRHEVEPTGAEVASIAPVATSSAAQAIRSSPARDGAGDGKSPRAGTGSADSNSSTGAGIGGADGTGGDGVGDGSSLAHADYAKNPPPAYPTAARRRAEQGIVTIRVLVGADGSVERAELAESSGYDLLDDAALHAVRAKWRFVPARSGGVTVESWVLVPIRFALTEASAAR